MAKDIGRNRIGGCALHGLLRRGWIIGWGYGKGLGYSRIWCGFFDCFSGVTVFATWECTVAAFGAFGADAVWTVLLKGGTWGHGGSMRRCPEQEEAKSGNGTKDHERLAKRTRKRNECA